MQEHGSTLIQVSLNLENDWFQNQPIKINLDQQNDVTTLMISKKES